MELKSGGNTVRIPIDKIMVLSRARPLDPSSVALMKATIAETGVIFDPIMVRERKGGFELIDGRHRLAVAQALGHDDIEARVWLCTQAEARFMEVTANLSVAHLTPLDFAVNMAERKRAYETLHPETKAGVAGALTRHGMQRTEMSFAEFMASVLGLTSRQIRRIVAAGAALSPSERETLRGAPKRIAMDDLYVIAKIGEGEDRAAVCRALGAGSAKSAASAWRALSDSSSPVKSPVEAAHERLLEAWARAPRAARQRFVASAYDDLSELVSDEFERREM